MAAPSEVREAGSEARRRADVVVAVMSEGGNGVGTGTGTGMATGTAPERPRTATAPPKLPPVARLNTALLDELTAVDATDVIGDGPAGGEGSPRPGERGADAPPDRAAAWASQAGATLTAAQAPRPRPSSPPPPPLPTGLAPMGAPPMAPAAPMGAPPMAPVATATRHIDLPLPPPGREMGPIREPTLPEPPPTRIARDDVLRDRPFTPPNVLPIPEVPEPGFINAIRYALTFSRARWQRAKAVKVLAEEIKQDTVALDVVLGTVGRMARDKRIVNRVLETENAAIDAAEGKQRQVEQLSAELAARQVDENAKFAEVESQRQAKVNEAESALGLAKSEYNSLEAQRRALRDKRKSLETRQRAYLKAAQERDEEAGRAGMGEQRSQLRRAGEELRRDAAALDPERQDVERRVTALDKPLAQVTAKVEALKAELDAARRSLADVREGHRHRLAEIDAEQGRKSRELAQAQAEIQRRQVTLGTLVNLHRVDDPDFAELYTRIDRLRGAIGARTAEIDRLTAERAAYDRASVVRGWVALGTGVLLAVTIIAILLWIF